MPLRDMQSLRVCYEVAKKHPSHLQEQTPAAPTLVVVLEYTVAKKKVKHVTDGLTSFKLKPDGLKVKELFEHIITSTRHASCSMELAPAAQLDIQLDPISNSSLDRRDF